MNIHTHMVGEERNNLLTIRDSSGLLYLFFNADMSFKLSPELPAN